MGPAVIGSVLRSVATIFVVALMLALLGLGLLATPQGSAWIVESIIERADGRITATGLRGTLLEGLAVDRLQVRAGRTTVTIEPAELTMNWPDLFRQRLRLTTARAEAVTIDLGPQRADEPQSRIEPLVLPVAIAVDRLEVESLTVRGVGEPVEVDEVRLQGELVDGVLRFETLTAAWQGFKVAGTGTFGTGEPFALNAGLRWAHAGQDVSGTGRVSGTLESLRFEQVFLVPTPVGVGGVLRLLDDEPEIIAEARWTQLGRRLPGAAAGMFRSERGRLRVRGWTDSFIAELEGLFQAPDLPEFRARIAATGNRQELALRQMVLDGLDGRVTGRGRIALPDEKLGRALRGELVLDGQGLNPKFVDPRFTGRLGFRGDLVFDANGNFSLAVADSSGTLLGRAFRGSGAIARKGDAWRFDQVRIVAGVNRLDVSGTLADVIAGTFRIDAPDLATLWPGYRGQLRGDGVVGGTTAKPILDLRLDGAGLATGDLRIGSLSVRGGIGARQQLNLDVTARSLALGPERLGDLQLLVAGKPADHRLDLSLSGGSVEVRLAADGSWQRRVLQQTVTDAVVTLPGEQRWTLRDPAVLRLAGTDVSVRAHCWGFGEASLCLADSRSGARGFDGGFNLQQFPLASLQPWFPDGLIPAGNAFAEVQVRDDRGRRTGSIRARLADAVLTYRAPDEEDDVQTRFDEFRLEVTASDEAVDYEAVVAESFGLRIEATGRVSEPFSDAPAIAGRIAGGVPDLRSLAPVLERFIDIADLNGRVVIDAALTGNARRPDIRGGLELDDGAFTVPAAGVTVDRIALSVVGREDGTAGIKGNARSGKGYVDLEGRLVWRDVLLPSGDLAIRGRVFDLIRLPEGLVQVSPDVRVALRDGQFRVSGEVLVPRASITLKRLEEGAVRPSPDAIVHGRELVTVNRKPPLFVLDGLAVRLGRQVTFDGFGLKTNLTGGLTLSQSLAADPRLVVADGVVTLKEGKFAAFGQKLEIERGSLIFAGGAVTDPGLDVKASREVTWEGRDVTVGVLLSGRLSRIQTTVFSEPAMGELDALSYLTTGKPLSAAGAGDRFSVANAAVSLGLNQALPVVQELGSALRVDEIGLDSTDAGGTAFVIGEQLGKDLFIRYSYGIFDKLGTVKATYKLGRRLSIEASSGEEQALDLIYSINW